MTTIQNARPLPRRVVPAGPPGPSRISFRRPVSRSGFIDAAWWPRTLDLAVELPPLLSVVWGSAREITRITYNLDAWDAAPRRMQIEGRLVRLGGFHSSDPTTVRLSDAWNGERIDVLVIAPDADPEAAERALLLAARSDNSYRAAEILAEAGLTGPGAS